MMRKRNERTMEYFVLFRDNSTPVSSSAFDRTESRELLAVDPFAYLWWCLGELTDRQATAVQTKLDLKFGQAFKKLPPYNKGECRSITANSQVSSNPAGGELYKEGCNAPYRTSIKGLSPRIDRTENLKENSTFVRQNTGTGRLPSGESREPQSEDVPPKNDFLIQSVYIGSHAGRFTVPEEQRSFLQLISVSTLMDLWRRVGYHFPSDPLLATAGLWIYDSAGYEFLVPEQEFSPEETFLIFRSSIAEQKLTPYQREVLCQCADIAERVRKVGDPEDINYATVPSVSGSEQLTTAVEHQSKIVDQTGTVTPQTEEDIADTIARLIKEGARWVSQNDYCDPRISSKRTPVDEKVWTRDTLRKYRESNEFTLSEKNNLLGKDKGENFFKRNMPPQTGIGAKKKYRYEYLLEAQYNLNGHATSQDD